VNKKILVCTVTAIILEVILKINGYLSFRGADLIYPFLKLLDPDRMFLHVTIHHLIQLTFALLLILIFSRIYKLSFRDFGFHFNEFRFNVKAVLIFSGIWVVIQTGVAILMLTLSGMPMNMPQASSVRNFAGYFLFQILLSGTSEEILFRALFITVMVYLWKNLFKTEKALHLTAASVSIILFMADHIGISWSPFRITHFSILQQLTCLSFACFYCYLFTRNKSILGPIMAHNILNGVITVVSLLLVFLFG